MKTVLLGVCTLLALAAAVLHGALRGGSPARLDQINQQRRRYDSLPDLDDAARALGTVKVILYTLLASLLALFASPPAGAAGGTGAVSPVLLATAAVLVLEAAALVTGGYQSGAALYRLVPLISVFERAGRAASAAAAGLALFMARLSGRQEVPAPEAAAQEEILDALSEGEREGVIEDREREMMESIIEFKDVEVSEVMTPRTEITAVNALSSLREILGTVVKSGHSRLPVWSENADNMVGVLYVKDILQYLEPNEMDRSVRATMRAPYFVPETKMVRELLQEFRTSAVHMAIVLDEYGGTSGIVTIEDIIEEIVGDIEDEYDEYEPPDIRTVGPQRAVVEGDAPVDEVNDTLGTKISENEEYETVAGYILFRAGRIPQTGETFEWEGVRFRILDADKTRIKRLMVEPAGGGAKGGQA